MLHRENLPLTFISKEYHDSRVVLPDPEYLKSENIKEPIDISLGRQLWVDDYLISEKNNIKRVYHQAVDVQNTPLLKLANFEGRSNSPLPDAVLFDNKDRNFKMWYVSNYEYVPHRLAMATSNDGINWTRVMMKDDYEFQTYSPCCDKCPKYNEAMVKKVHKPNNLIGSFGGCRNFRGRGSGSIVHDLTEKDKSKRFKLVWGAFGKIHVHTSPDGIQWNEEPKRGGHMGGSVWYCSYNPFRQKWLFTMRDNLPHLAKGRLVRYMEVDNLLDQWPKWDDGQGNGLKKYVSGHPVQFCMADNLDVGYTRRKPGIYCAILLPYESIMVNLFSVYHGGDGFKKRCSTYAGFSRDGFHYTREHEGRLPLIPETKTKYYICPTGGNMLIIDERIYLYYFYKTGNYMNTGVSTLRRDGFVSLQSKDPTKMSTITTKLLKPKKDACYLFVNALCHQNVTSNNSIDNILTALDKNNYQSYLKAEVLDEQNHVIKGYETSQCVALRNRDSTKYMIKWTDKESLPKNKNIKLRFFMFGCQFYSFWISMSQHGESLGYIGGGGPSYHGQQDIQKNYTNPPVIFSSKKNNQKNNSRIQNTVPLDEEITRASMRSMKGFDRQEEINQRIKQRELNRQQRQKTIEKLAPFYPKNIAPNRINKLNTKKGTKNEVSRAELANSNNQIVKAPQPIISNQKLFCQPKLVFDRKKNKFTGCPVYTKIEFEYYDLLVLEKYEKCQPVIFQRKLDIPVVRITSSEPLYKDHQYRPTTRPFGKVISLKFLTVNNKEIEMVLIYNNKSEAMITNISLLP